MSPTLRVFAFSLGTTLVFYKFHGYLGTVVYCEGISMEPTIQHGDYLLVEKLSLYRGQIKKLLDSLLNVIFSGDIVVARQLRESGTCCHILKRVRATGGEAVNYWSPKFAKSVTVYVPEKHVWLEGDNKRHSLDSRTYGSVPMGHLEYRVFCRLWPPSSFGRFDKGNHTR
ncbi:mitochondrial inner membrane protease subunit [Echinococcus multilocularis]|uniref:Mitochondrial inner membrane protease subunit n=1 Tax=Echinococcus multilocularis TaxID=6211 RepID=A0A068YKJ9_ECHMU|nr:mitochondrial inner membrane protease subunit [Echinococcus multilocularis]